MAAAPDVSSWLDPSLVRVWREGAWWRHDETHGWIGVSSQPTTAQWASAPATATPLLASIARASLDLSSGMPIAFTSPDGTVYLVTDEWGTPGARVLVGAQGAAALASLPPPPLVVVLRPQPFGAAGIRSSADKVRRAIRAGRNNPFLIAWTRQVIQAANLPGQRGFPDPTLVVGALFEAQKREMAFVKDPVSGEMMANPAQLLCLDPAGLCLRGGDCDDQLIVLGSATMSAGIDVRLIIRHYRGASQAHITMGYQTARGWTCIDPSTDTGACSAAPYQQEQIVEIIPDDEAMTTGGDFVGLGHLGAPPDALLPDDEAHVWIEALGDAADLLARARTRLAQNLSACTSTLGSPVPDDDGERSRLLATADVLGQAIAEGLEGLRELGVTSGDLLLGPRPGDAFAVSLLETDDGARMPVYLDGGEASSLGAAIEIARLCDAEATAVLEHAASTLGTWWNPSSPDDVLAEQKRVEQARAALATAVETSPPKGDPTTIDNAVKGWNTLNTQVQAYVAADPSTFWWTRDSQVQQGQSYEAQIESYRQTFARLGSAVPPAPAAAPGPGSPPPGSPRDFGAQALDIAKAIGIAAGVVVGAFAAVELVKGLGWLGSSVRKATA